MKCLISAISFGMLGSVPRKVPVGKLQLEIYWEFGVDFVGSKFSRRVAPKVRSE